MLSLQRLNDMEQGIIDGVSSKRQVMTVKVSVINHCKVFYLNKR